MTPLKMYEWFFNYNNSNNKKKYFITEFVQFKLGLQLRFASCVVLSKVQFAVWNCSDGFTRRSASVNEWFNSWIIRLISYWHLPFVWTFCINQLKVFTFRYVGPTIGYLLINNNQENKSFLITIELTFLPQHSKWRLRHIREPFDPIYKAFVISYDE